MAILRFRGWSFTKQEMCTVIELSFVSDTKDIVTLYGKDGPIMGEAPFDCIIMQSTGLNDKNGIEIFEGDIVRFIHVVDMSPGPIQMEEFLGIVMWDEEMAGFGIATPECSGDETEIMLCRDSEYSSTEVLGNVYENFNLWEDVLFGDYAPEDG